MAQNYLAPTPNNALAYSVPQPYVPGTLQDPRAVYSPYRELENLSIGLGRGATAGLEGTKQMLTQPVVTARALIEAARQFSDDPRIVLEMLREARRKAMSGALGLGELIGENVTPGMRARRPTMQELDVYHGTPHRFEPTPANPLGEFDASKIGTGEGAQAYGRGIYFAEQPDVAKGYMLAGNYAFPSVFINGKPLTELQDFAPDASDFLEAFGKKFGEIKGAKAKQLALMYAPEHIKEKYKNIPDSAFTVSRKEGTFYKADLPDEMVNRMIDYDKPFSQQSPQVQQAILKALEIRKRQTGGYGLFDPLEQTNMKDLLGSIGEERLRQAGVPGVKYLDAGSRGGAGTRNFVVFPGEEKKVRILERK